MAGIIVVYRYGGGVARRLFSACVVSGQ